MDVPPATSAVAGVGVDAVEVERVRRALDRTPGLAGRLFTDAERAYASRFRDPAPRLAARFAAKEAVMKALGAGLGSVAPRDIEVERSASGRPAVRLHASAARAARGQGVARVEVSITHTAQVAVAFAVALRA